MKKKVLFVCLGNICRSPLAEALFTKKVKEMGIGDSLQIDSCGTSNYHQGELADARTLANAAEHGVQITHRSRPFNIEDFEKWDTIVVMDSCNFENIAKLSKDIVQLEKIKYMREYEQPVGNKQDVPDPWFGGEEGFETVYQLLDNCTQGLAASIINN